MEQSNKYALHMSILYFSLIQLSKWSWERQNSIQPHEIIVNNLFYCSTAQVSIITLPVVWPLSVDDEIIHNGPLKTYDEPSTFPSFRHLLVRPLLNNSHNNLTCLCSTSELKYAPENYWSVNEIGQAGMSNYFPARRHTGLFRILYKMRNTKLRMHEIGNV